MPKLDNLSGQRFGRLVAVSREGTNKSGRPLWRCICDCGNEKLTAAKELKNGKTKSCGCYRAEILATHNISHGQTRGKKSRMYKCWLDMKARCTNPNNKFYKDYGGRGIKVCERWLNSFENFKEDMGEMPDNLTIERIDFNKDYEPGNCKWATYTEQARNTSRNRLITYKGETKCLAEWAETLGMTYQTLNTRINKHKWDIERAFTQPARKSPTTKES
ncbi:hypothetical protein OsccyDRAFT_0687 [Leptolyngbyaceae cyanobacterium JSC-12]|nr:hypothetical protein OsccyDRAFT_0687 [Leptolyngbyaceae cyanobacterium JSC-12]